MQKTSAELTKEITDISTEMGAVLNRAESENRSVLTDDERNAYDAGAEKLKAAQDAKAMVERKEMQSALEAELRQTVKKVPSLTGNYHVSGGGEIRSHKPGEFGEAFRSWLFAGTPKGRFDSDTAHRCAQFGMSLGSDICEIRALTKSTSDTPKAGYTVSESFSNELIKTLKYFCPIRNYTRHRVDPQGNPFKWPRIDGTALAPAIVAEAGTISDSIADPSFTSVTMGAYRYPSGICRLSMEIEQDSAFDLEQEIGQILGEAIGRSQEAAFMGTNAGTTAPQGMQNFAGDSGVTMDISDGLTYANLVDTYYGVDPAYRNHPSCAWVMSDGFAARVRKLADSTGRPLWEFSMQEGQPDRILGKPVVISNTLPNGGTAATKPLLFGCLNSYAIRDIQGVTFQRLTELYAVTGEIGYIATARADGRGVGPSSSLVYMDTQA